MASSTRWAWVWVNSGSWWWTGRPGLLRFMGAQRVGHDWATELNWTEPFPSSEDLPNPGIKLESPELQAYSLWSEPPGKPEDLGGPDLWLETKRLADQHHFRDIETLIPDKSFAESRDGNKMNKNVPGAYQGKGRKGGQFFSPLSGVWPDTPLGPHKPLFSKFHLLHEKTESCRKWCNLFYSQIFSNWHNQVWNSSSNSKYALCLRDSVIFTVSEFIVWKTHWYRAKGPTGVEQRTSGDCNRVLSQAQSSTKFWVSPTKTQSPWFSKLGESAKKNHGISKHNIKLEQDKCHSTSSSNLTRQREGFEETCCWQHWICEGSRDFPLL